MGHTIKTDDYDWLSLQRVLFVIAFFLVAPFLTVHLCWFLKLSIYIVFFF